MELPLSEMGKPAGEAGLLLLVFFLFVLFLKWGGGRLLCFWWEQGTDQEFSFGHAKCGMSVRHPS